MTAPQNFRSAFNGFNREDVVHYLEFINTKHTTQVNQLTAENEALRAQLEQQGAPDRCEELDSLKEQVADLTAQLEEALAKCTQLEQQPAHPQEEPASTLSPSAAEELEAYRRAERIEREAKERAELVYFQANGVLTEAAAKVDGISAEITDMADQVMTQLTQLQMAVSSSKQALQDASSIMNTIRPNK